MSLDTTTKVATHTDEEDEKDQENEFIESRIDALCRSNSSMHQEVSAAATQPSTFKVTVQATEFKQKIQKTKSESRTGALPSHPFGAAKAKQNGQAAQVAQV
jgi:hypothetical protein